MNTAVEAFCTTEGQRSLEGLLNDVVNFDDTPCIVAWDNINNKVGFFEVFFGFFVCLDHFVQPRWQDHKVMVLYFPKLFHLDQNFFKKL